MSKWFEKNLQKTSKSWKLCMQNFRAKWHTEIFWYTESEIFGISNFVRHIELVVFCVTIWAKMAYRKTLVCRFTSRLWTLKETLETNFYLCFLINRTSIHHIDKTHDVELQATLFSKHSTLILLEMFPKQESLIPILPFSQKSLEDIEKSQQEL